MSHDTTYVIWVKCHHVLATWYYEVLVVVLPVKYSVFHMILTFLLGEFADELVWVLVLFLGIVMTYLFTVESVFTAWKVMAVMCVLLYS